jgi:hypothetical protein
MDVRIEKAWQECASGTVNDNRIFRHIEIFADTRDLSFRNVDTIVLQHL